MTEDELKEVEKDAVWLGVHCGMDTTLTLTAEIRRCWKIMANPKLHETAEDIIKSAAGRPLKRGE